MVKKILYIIFFFQLGLFELQAVVPVSPLLKSIRHQKMPFNNSCPYFYKDSIKSEQRCMVGCVATSLEQIINYYRYPEMLLDTLKGWETNNYTINDIVKGTKIDYSNILNYYKEGEYNLTQAKAVADLSYMCGIAAHMNWNINESGAGLDSLIEPLKNVFGYKYVRRAYSYSYTPNHWKELIYNELKHKRPVLFVGYTSLIQGHAFVVDGINEEGLYHLNWGYGGNYDGYFDLDILNAFEKPSQTTDEGKVLGFFSMQEALFLNPYEVEYDEGDTLVDKSRLAIDSVKFMRDPDLNKYVTAKVYVRNTSSDSINSSMEIYTFDGFNEDTVMVNIDANATIATRLAPMQKDSVLAYLTFKKAGKKLFAITANDSLNLFVDTIEVKKTYEPKTEILDVDSVIGSDRAEFNIELKNLSSDYWAGNMITYSLFDGYYTTEEGDTRHWQVMNTPPLRTEMQRVVFEELKPNTFYTFIIRNPWLPVYTLPFTTQGTSGIIKTRIADIESHKSHDINGLNIIDSTNGIIIKNRKKWYLK